MKNTGSTPCILYSLCSFLVLQIGTFRPQKDQSSRGEFKEAFLTSYPLSSKAFSSNFPPISKPSNSFLQNPLDHLQTNRFQFYDFKLLDPFFNGWNQLRITKFTPTLTNHAKPQRSIDADLTERESNRSRLLLQLCLTNFRIHTSKTNQNER